MPKIRNIIIFIVIAAAFVAIYIYFIKPSFEQASLVSLGSGVTLPNIDGSTANTSNINPLITKDFLAIFSNVKNLKLDDTIFSDPAFNNLHDSSIVLVPDGTEGRPNPFAQFGNDRPVAGVSGFVAGPSGSTLPANSSTGIPNP